MLRVISVMSFTSNIPTRAINGHIHSASVNDYPLFEIGQARYTGGTKKQIKGSRRSTTSTSSALALLAFLFFLNMLQRSLDDSKPQGVMVMTRTTTTHPTLPRNEVTENKQLTAITTLTTQDNVSRTRYENIFNKFLK